jgi:putative glutamine amidotransferase
MKFAVSISSEPDAEAPSRGYDFVRHPYVPYLEKLGVVPILVPNNLSDLRAFVTATGIDGVLLTGGGDVAPNRYGQPNIASEDIVPARDQTEYGLLELAVERNLPVLGICRGIQVINVFLGGGLLQDLPTQLHSPVRHDGGDPHAIRIIDLRVSGVIGCEDMHVNTFHHQGITPDLLAPPLEVFAVCAADGLVEGVIHRTQPILGVQWHPERPTPSLDFDLRLFRRFLQGPFWLHR